MTFLFWRFDPWDVATSNPVLLLIAALMLAAFIVGNFPVIGRIPAIAPYVVLSRFAAFLALALLMFLIGFRVADNRAERAQLETELNWQRGQAEQQKATAEDAERLKREAEARASELSKKVEGYEEHLAKQQSAGVCTLDDADLEWLRGIAR